MSDKLGFGIIGSGRMGQRRAKNIQANTGARVVCVADTDASKGQKLAKEIGCDHCADPFDVLNKPGVDCVVVSVPNKFHIPFVVAAAKAKKHVFCEKPLARDPQEAREIVKAASANGILLKTGSPFRYMPNVMKAKELLDSSAIGDPLFIRANIGVPGSHLKGFWIADIEQTGGGVFLDMGVHLLDTVRWFLGEVEGCQGQKATMLWPIGPSEDCAMGLYRFEKGRMAFVQASWLEWAGYANMEIFGSKGYIIIDCREPNSTTVLGNQEGYRQVFDFTRLPPQSYQLEMNDFISAIQQHRQPQASGSDGLRAVQMAHAVYESAKQGREIILWGKEAQEAFLPI